MKPFSLFLFLFVFLFTSFLLFAQDNHLVGETSEQEIREQHRLFDIYTKRYSPDSASIVFLSQFRDSIHISVVFGTWCHDSKKQIPAFMKTLETANNPLITVDYIAVDKRKNDPKNLAKTVELEVYTNFYYL